MEPIKVYDLIDQTGIETLFGATPVQLPVLSTDDLQSHVDVEADLLQTDAELAQTAQTLAVPQAVVRVHRHGLETSPGVFWLFVGEGHLVQLTVELKPSGQVRLTSLADSTALFNEIARLLAMPAMPEKAYARAVLDRDDAENIFSLSQGSGFNAGAELMVSDGLTEEEARVAFDVFRTASVTGRISFMAVQGDEVELTHGIAVGKDGGDVWMVSAAPAQSKDLVLETVMAGALHRQLVTGWSSLGVG